jgi:hypothetical protein
MNLTQRPPRASRVRLGGYVILPRMLDKGRAELAGTNGEFHYNCPLDQHFLNFVGIDPVALKAELAKGLGDWEILNWINANAKKPREQWEIDAWSTHQLNRSPSDVESQEFFAGLVKKIGPLREDIATWTDMLDLDDYVTFGGKP